MLKGKGSGYGDANAAAIERAQDALKQLALPWDQNRRRLAGGHREDIFRGMTASLQLVASLPQPLAGAELARARAYLYGGLAGAVAAEVWLVATLGFIFVSGMGTRVALRWRDWLPWRALAAAASTATVGAVALLALLPFDYWLDFRRERSFGFQHLTALGWLAQWGLSSLVTLGVAAGVGWLVYGWIGRRPRRWWLKLWLVLAAGAVLAVALDPIVIEPLFHRFQPVQDAAARTEIESLAARAGIPNAQVLEMDASRDSAHTNAYVVGVLGSQRIIVYDTLLRDTPPDELAFIVCHEIGHYVLHHLWKGLGFAAAYMLLMCAIAGALFERWGRGTAPGDAAGVALLLALLVGSFYATAILPNSFSRWEEHQADAYGLWLTGDGCAAAAGFLREEHSDLIYPDPPALIVDWCFNHPSQQQRIDFALRNCPLTGTGPSVRSLRHIEPPRFALVLALARGPHDPTPALRLAGQ